MGRWGGAGALTHGLAHRQKRRVEVDRMSGLPPREAHSRRHESRSVYDGIWNGARVAVKRWKLRSEVAASSGGDARCRLRG